MGETDIDRGVWADRVLGGITVREWVNRYLRTMTHLKPKTRVGYDSPLNATILPVLDDVPFGKPYPIIVQEWLESEPVILTHDQVSALVASCRHRMNRRSRPPRYGGLRIGEALAVWRNCVDLLGRRITVRESVSDANGQPSFQSPKAHQQ
jgi:integrase